MTRSRITLVLVVLIVAVGVHTLTSPASRQSPPYSASCSRVIAKDLRALALGVRAAQDGAADPAALSPTNVDLLNPGSTSALTSTQLHTTLLSLTGSLLGTAPGPMLIAENSGGVQGYELYLDCSSREVAHFANVVSHTLTAHPRLYGLSTHQARGASRRLVSVGSVKQTGEMIALSMAQYVVNQVYARTFMSPSSSAFATPLSDARIRAVPVSSFASGTSGMVEYRVRLSSGTTIRSCVAVPANPQDGLRVRVVSSARGC